MPFSQSYLYEFAHLDDILNIISNNRYRCEKYIMSLRVSMSNSAYSDTVFDIAVGVSNLIRRL